MTRPWSPGSATGIGSLPGTDPAEAARLVLGELPDLPHLAELPERGAPADMIGRGVALLVDLPAEIAPSGWQLCSRPGQELRRARDLLAWDLDALEEQAEGYVGPLKLQIAGPWTLGAGVELPTGHRIVSDRGAMRDLAASLAEGVRRHLEDVAKRVPGAQLVLQVDEPSLPTVLAGTVPTPSGWGLVRAVEESHATEVLGELLALAPAGGRVVHCCARDVPIALLQRAGVDAVALDATLLRTRHFDALGELVDGGGSLWLGVLPTDVEPHADAARSRIARLWSALGFGQDLLAGTVVPTPVCGLASSSEDRVREVLAVLRQLGKDLLDPLQPGEDADRDR